MSNKKTKLDWHVYVSWVTDYARAKFLDNGNINTALSWLTQVLPGMSEEIAEQVIRGTKKLTGMDDLYLEDDDKVIEPSGWIKPSDITKCSCGWIAPNGKVYGLETYSEQQDHDELAREIVKRGDVKGDEEHAYNAVETAGYIKFSPFKAYAYAKPGAITEEQRNKVLLFIEARGYTEFQLGANALGIESVTRIRSMELLQFGKRITNDIF